MAFDFKNLFGQLKTAVDGLAKEKFSDLVTQAKSDGASLLQTIKDNLQDYTKQLVNGDITKDDFKLLILGNEDLVEMTALTQAGLVAAQADAFKTSVFNTIFDTVFKAI